VKKATYQNRYESINLVVSVMGEFGCETATEISKKINLSRQNILDVLKHAETWGYVYHKEVPYRYHKDGTLYVSKKLWYPTTYGLEHANWYVKAMNKYNAGRGMKPLL
jgi:predicted transcriptional regulator